jgi:hypothetical protein
MPGPREQEKRKTQLSPETPLDKSPGRLRHEVNTSKREEDEGKVEDPPSSTRAARPRSGRSGSDSNASRRSRGH